MSVLSEIETSPPPRLEPAAHTGAAERRARAVAFGRDRFDAGTHLVEGGLARFLATPHPVALRATTLSRKGRG
jgi:hypothetical protein